MRFFFAVFSYLLPKFSNFVNADGCIGKMTSKSIRINTIFISQKIEFDKILIFSSEKMINSGNYI